MEQQRISGWMIAVVIGLTFIVTMIVATAIVIIAERGSEEGSASSLEERVDLLEQAGSENQGTQPTVQQNGGRARSGSNNSGNSESSNSGSGSGGSESGGSASGSPQAHNHTHDDQQVVATLSYNYVTTERPDLYWQVTRVTVNGDVAEVGLEGTYAGGREIRIYHYQRRNGNWVLTSVARRHES